MNAENKKIFKSPLGRSWGLTRNIPFPNIYVKMLPEYEGWIYLEEEAMQKKGRWRATFLNQDLPLDLEIGCGNGFFFAQQASGFQNRNLLGIELKYKPLVQTVRRVKRAGLQNAKGIRFHARYIDSLFEKEELDNVFIYFPDPWPKKRHLKNRLLQKDFIEMLHGLQKPGSFVDFKTDSEDYFNFAEGEIRKSSYRVARYSRDLHRSEFTAGNFVTAFENIFIKKGQPIFYMRLEK